MLEARATTSVSACVGGKGCVSVLGNVGECVCVRECGKEWVRCVKKCEGMGGE